ncbi:iron ABC transporter substrate-binding protein [Bacteroides sp. 214]|uniref:ABC transporter substrate-binding protein n=1 Tax=Bacteroides sp. 214 TaxID=2302935 RepID=UPI0013D6EACD|nr:ABC transporter substrate-binding protein [Bacteroides sp. 214]NDW13511.1 iron ABC transporter substrate-binding protein [Bacteroides sp. 214]
MGNRFILSIIFIIILLLSACGKQKEQRTEQANAQGKSIEITHAELFTITVQESYTTVSVLNPWKTGEVYDTYYLVTDNDTPTPANGRKVTIPITRLMTNSATHLGFLELLNELDVISGICSPDFIYNPTVREAVKAGRVQDMGDAFNLNIEKLLLLHPQAVMTTAYNADDENSKKMRQTGLTVIYNIEWQEKTLLGRAEWIKFVGAFFNKSALADSVFQTIEAQYNKVKALATTQSHQPTILSGQDFRGSWSMPGGQSYSGQLFRDAGGNYYYKKDTSSGSISSTIEEALVHFNKAEVWVGAQASTLEELGKTDSKYKLFDAFKSGNVYNNNKRMNATGGNDFWESGVARPDLLLSDMIKVLHPELLPNYEFTYFNRLAP